MNFLSVLYAKAGITVDGVTTLNNTATGLTPATNDNSTKLATTGFVKNQNYYPYPTGTTAQYVRGDGSLATFTQTGGGGSSVSYYLNGGTSQGTIGGNTYYEMSKIAVIGAAADFNLNADGYIAQFVTDAGDPALLSIPGGNWNFEMFFSASSGGGTPSFYVELYKYDGTTLTLISSGSTNSEPITSGTATDLYLTSLAVPTTTLTLTDRLAIRVYVNHSGRTITLHTQNGHLCQVITSFTTGLTALNGLTAQVQNFAVGAGGSDFNISSVIDTHTFNLPTASATKRGALSSIDWSAFDAKVDFGDLSATSPLNYNGSGLFTIAQSSASTNGYLSSTDWTTFNNKIGGSGTTNYLPKFTGASALGNSLIYDSGDGIGIGTTSPNYTTSGRGVIDVNGSSQSMYALSVGGVGKAFLFYTGADLLLSNESAGEIKFNTNGSQKAVITSAGNVGIGTTNPDVFGRYYSGTILGISSAGQSAIELNSATGNGAYFDMGVANARTFSIYSDATSTDIAAIGNRSLGLSTNGNNRIFISGNGNVGVNTNGVDAGYKLDVNGTAIVRGRISTIGGSSNDVYTQYTTIADITNTNDYVLRFNNNAGSQIGYIGIISSGGVFQYNNSNGHNFTGAATFSSSVTATSGLFSSTGVGVFNSQLTINNTTSASALITFQNTINGFAFGFSSIGTGGQRFSFFNGAPTEIAYIAGTGAATFSSSVTATNFSNAGLQSGEVFNATKSNAGYFVGYLQNTSITGYGLYIQNGTDSLPAIRIGNAAGTVNAINLYGSGIAEFSSSVTATNFIVPGGTSAQFLKADGSLDSNVYLTATSSTFSYTASVTLSPTWQNTGVSSANLGTGAYLVTCNANDFGVGGGQYNCTYTGLMYFFAGGTNGSNANEIVLHHTGHADNDRYIYLRTLNTTSADGKTYLQISGNGTNSAASNYQLTFKKLL